MAANDDSLDTQKLLAINEQLGLNVSQPSDDLAATVARRSQLLSQFDARSTDLRHPQKDSPEAHPHPHEQAPRPSNALNRGVMDPPDLPSGLQTAGRASRSPRTYSKRRTTARDALIDRRALGFFNSQSDVPTPRLTRANSTPTPAMAVEYNGAPPYHSFAGVSSGDTQPMDTQAFKTASNLGDLLNANNGQEQVPAIQHETEAHEVDLVGSLEDEDEDADIEISSIPDESPKVTFKTPMKPAMAGSKRDSMGNLVSSVTRSSSSRPPPSVLKRMFGNGHAGGNLSLTQAFDGTQNISSPTAGLQSDPVFERPSPNFRLEHSSPAPNPFPRRITSDPMGQASSATDNPAPRTPSDPIQHYRSMAESQEERDRREKEEESRREKGDLDDSLLESLPVEVERRLRQRKKEEAMLKEFASFRETTRPRSAGAAFSDEKIATPKRNPEPINVPDDTPMSDSDDESHADATEFAPTSVQVPMTSSRGKSPSQLPISSSPTKTNGGNAVHVHGTDEDAPVGGRASDTQKSYAIADSQDRAVGGREKIPSTPDTRIVQSQYSARAAKVIDTSSVPMPLPTTSQAQAEQIPSSPPAEKEVMTQVDTHEHDVVNEVTGFETNAADGEEAIHEANVEGMQVDERDVPQNSRRTTIPEPDPIDSAEPYQQSDLCGRQPSNMFSKTDTSEATSRALNGMSKDGTEVFDTAKTHLSPSDQEKVNHMKIPTQISNLTDESPEQRGRVRKLTEIAADEPEPQASLLSGLEFDLINSQDQEHLDVMAGRAPKAQKSESSHDSSPVPTGRAAKRRKLDKPKPLSEPARNVNIVDPQDNVSGEADDEDDEPEDLIVHKPAPLKKAKSPTKSLVPKRGQLKRPSKRPATYGGKAKPASREENRSSSAQPEQTRATIAPTHSKERRKDLAMTTPATTKAAEIVEEVCVPNRVFAYFGGNLMAYYPATCTDKVHLNQLEVRFDDGTTVFLEQHQIRRLDLHVGDVVKIDRNQMRGKTYIVQSFKDKIDPSTEELPLTDIRGYKMVLLTLKGRDSTSSSKLDDSNILETPVTDIFLNGQLWPKFADRPYEPTNRFQSTAVMRLLTPSEGTSVPTTPSSRSRRKSLNDAKTSHLRDSFEATSTKRTRLFASMVFAISLGANEDSKNSLIKAVLENGGSVLELGFDELFHEIDASKTYDGSGAPGGGGEALRLRAWAQNTGFTALLAASHSRTAKYVQALALNLPCVHYRWVVDCVAKGEVKGFGKYLLPAGESAFLGAVRSRVLTPYDPLSEEARLENVLGRRKLLLGGMRVLFVTGKGKAEERKRAYEFLTFVMGAKEVVKVRDVGEARKEVKGREFDVVYVEGDEEVRRVIFEDDGAKKGRKRKRGEELEERSVVNYGGKKPMFVNDEGVVQSFILGDLLE